MYVGSVYIETIYIYIYIYCYLYKYICVLCMWHELTGLNRGDRIYIEYIGQALHVNVLFRWYSLSQMGVFGCYNHMMIFFMLFLEFCSCLLSWSTRAQKFFVPIMCHYSIIYHYVCTQIQICTFWPYFWNDRILLSFAGWQHAECRKIARLVEGRGCNTSVILQYCFNCLR